jgi:hypothetical protein
VAIHAWAAFEGGREAVSPAFGLEVRAPEPARAKRRSKGGQAGGLVATVKDAKGEEHEFPVPAVGPARGNRFAQLLREKVGTGVREVILRGSLQAPGTGPCRLAINAAGDLEVKVGGETVFDAEGLVFDRQRHAAFALRQGRTEIEVTYVPSGDGDLVLWLGGTGVTAPM